MTENSIPTESFSRDSVLTSIKKLLGIMSEDQAFDDELIMHINSAFMVLHQLGVGEPNPLYIDNAEATWNDILPGYKKLNQIKTYVYLKVRVLFDPPTASGVLAAFEKQILEHEWRINHEAESIKEAANVNVGL